MRTRRVTLSRHLFNESVEWWGGGWVKDNVHVYTLVPSPCSTPIQNSRCWVVWYHEAEGHTCCPQLTWNTLVLVHSQHMSNTTWSRKQSSNTSCYNQTYIDPFIYTAIWCTHVYIAYSQVKFVTSTDQLLLSDWPRVWWRNDDREHYTWGFSSIPYSHL